MPVPERLKDNDGSTIRSDSYYHRLLWFANHLPAFHFWQEANHAICYQIQKRPSRAHWLRCQEGANLQLP